MNLNVNRNKSINLQLKNNILDVIKKKKKKHLKIKTDPTKDNDLIILIQCDIIN